MKKEKYNLLSSSIEQISANINSSLELKEILLATCRTTVQTFNIDHSGLVLFDTKLEYGKVEAEYPSWNLVGKTIPLQGVPDEEKLTKTRKPLMITDITKQRTLGPVRALLMEYGIKSTLLIPVVNKGQLLGSFSLDISKGARKFTVREIKLCRLIAEQVGAAIENAKLFSTLVSTSNHLEGLMSSSLDAVVFIDHKKCVTVFNKQAEEIFGYKAKEIKGQTVGVLHTDINEAKKIWNIVHTKGRISTHEVSLKHKDGTKIPVILSAVSIKDIEGKEVGQAGFMHTRLVEDRLHALIMASQAVNGTLDLDMVLERVMEAAISAFPNAEKGVIHLFDPDNNLLYVRAHKGYSPEVIQAVTFRSGEGRAGWVYQNSTPLVIGNLFHDQRAKKISKALGYPEVQEQKSTICVPLKVKGKTIGTLSLDNLTIFDAFKVSDIRLLSIFADQVAIAIENAQLFNQSQRNWQIVSSFYETSSKLHPTFSPNRALKFIADRVKATMGALSVSITSLDSGGRAYEKAHQGYDEKQRVVRSGGLSSVVMKTGKPLIVSDVANTTVTLNPGMINSGVKSAICLPLQAQGKNLGVMWVTFDRPHQFSSTETNLLGLLANQAGAFIASAHLTQERKLLLDTSKMVLLAQDLDHCLQTLAEMMIKSLAATFCCISLVDEAGRLLTTRAAYPVVSGLKWEPAVGQQYLLKTSPDEEQAIKTGKTRVFFQERKPKFLSILKQRTNLQGEIKSAVLIPLSIGKKVFGIIILGERRGWDRGSFSLERVGLYQAMAGQVAAFIARMRLQEQSKNDFSNLQRLYEASSKIGATLDPDQTLHFIVEMACQALQGWRATAILLDENKQPHRLATSGFEKEIKTATSIRMDGISMNVIRNGRPCLIEDIKSFRGKANPAMIRDGVQAAICVPLRLGKNNIGVLWIHYKNTHQFLPTQIEALKLYAAQASIAYDNAQKMRELEHMHHAAESITGALELPQVLKQIVDSACEVLEANSSAIWSYDDSSNQFIPEELVAHGIPPKKLEKFQKKEPKEGGTANTVMAKGWIGIRDIGEQKYDFLGSSTQELLSSIGAQSFQGIALKIGNEKLGVLYVNYNMPKKFIAKDRKTLETFAYHAAMALKKARLLEELRRAQEAAKVVAKLILLGDKAATLRSVALGTKQTLGCDAVVLFEYNQAAAKLVHPPTMLGVRDPEKASQYGEVAPGSLVYEMLQQEKPYVVKKVADDKLFRNKRFAKEEAIQSCLAIPLRVDGHKVGVMFVNYRSYHRFTVEELTNIELFANQATVAIRNAQLHSEVKKRLEVVEALHEAGRTITDTLTLDKTLSRITEQALRVVGSHYPEGSCFSHIALLEDGKLPFVAAHPPRMLKLLQKRINIDLEHSEKIGVVGRVAKTETPLKLDNVSNDQDYIQTTKGTRSQLSVPIKTADKVIGVLSIEHQEYNAFVNEDVRALELLANQAGVAIENARLFKAARQRAENLDAILHVSQTSISSLELEKILTAACQTAVDLLKVDHSGLALFDEELKTAKIYAEYPDLGTTGWAFPLQGVPIEEQLISSRKPIQVYDVIGEPGLDAVRDILNPLQTRSILIVPIENKGRLLGSLGLDVMKTHYKFTREQTELCEVFAAQVAVAIENARQYEELKQTKGMVGARTALAWMGMANSTWRHTIEGYAINIRNVITLMRQDAQKISLTQKQQDLWEKRLSLIDSQAIKILEKPITPPLSSEEGLETISVNDLVRERLSQLSEDDSFRTISLQMELSAENTRVRISPDWFRRALDILIGNAVDAMSSSKIRRLTVSSNVRDDQVELMFSDTGKGIPPYLQDKLFKTPIVKPEGSKGFGMGLLMVEAIMHAYRGVIRLQSSNSRGTRFVLSLPLIKS
jgi:PAS domain S-box-containing protein